LRKPFSRESGSISARNVEISEKRKRQKEDDLFETVTKISLYKHIREFPRLCLTTYLAIKRRNRAYMFHRFVKPYVYTLERKITISQSCWLPNKFKRHYSAVVLLRSGLQFESSSCQIRTSVGLAITNQTAFIIQFNKTTGIFPKGNKHWGFGSF
jgi:hypothetical protein